mmetsp:Transcript_21421/g.46529  ORF Transcript_21421/g.46529 Transcript_21421/m.46529 type:complete len:133 (+) Transcript_21421:1970-2368(+)
MVSTIALVVTCVHYGEESCCRNDGHDGLLDRLAHAVDALECSVANANAIDGVGLRVLNDTHLYQRAATWAADHPHDASLESCLEIHAERAMEKTWVKFDRSWSLQGWRGNSFPWKDENLGMGLTDASCLCAW